jgi:hypothetical protein
MGVKVFCKHCGKANEREQEVCGQCGKPLSASPQTKIMKEAIAHVPPPKGLEKGGSTVVLKPSDIRPAYVRCPQCSQTSRSSSKFCNKCGSKLENAPAADTPVSHAAAAPGEAAAPPAPAPDAPREGAEATAPPGPGASPAPAPPTAENAFRIPPLKITRGPSYFGSMGQTQAPDASPAPGKASPAVSPAGQPRGARAPAEPASATPARPRIVGGLSAKIDRSHRKAAQVCDECGVLNVGYEQCVDCGGDLKKPGPDRGVPKPQTA